MRIIRGLIEHTDEMQVGSPRRSRSGLPFRPMIQVDAGAFLRNPSPFTPGVLACSGSMGARDVNFVNDLAQRSPPASELRNIRKAFVTSVRDYFHGRNFRHAKRH